VLSWPGNVPAAREVSAGSWCPDRDDLDLDLDAGPHQRWNHGQHRGAFVLDELAANEGVGLDAAGVRRPLPDVDRVGDARPGLGQGSLDVLPGLAGLVGDIVGQLAVSGQPRCSRGMICS
jgi:hypothetical protein